MKPSESGVTATEQFPTHKLFLPLPWFLRPMAVEGFLRRRRSGGEMSTLGNAAEGVWVTC